MAIKKQDIISITLDKDSIEKMYECPLSDEEYESIVQEIESAVVCEADYVVEYITSEIKRKRIREDNQCHLPLH